MRDRVSERTLPVCLAVLAALTWSNAAWAQAVGPVAAYAFNETSGTAALDGSGNGLTGTLTNGATFGPGKNGNAVALDGANDFVNLGNPTALQLTGSMTLSGWINAQTFPRDDAVIVSKRSNNPLGFQLDTTVDQGPRTVGFKLTNAAGSNMFRYGATALQLNTWYHIAGVYNAATQTLNVYLNGQLDNGVLVGTVTTTQQNSSMAVHIGQRPGAPGTFNFAGKIDDVRLYSRALTQADIQADMTTPVGGTPPPNTPPTITSLGNQVTNEDTATGALGFTVGDAETAPGSLTVTASSSNLALVPTANLALGGSGAARTVTVTPVANQSGTATITLTVSDGQAPASTSFLLTVLPVNDPPTITGIANQTIPVGGVVGPLAFTVGDLETAAGSLTVSGSSSNPTLVPDPNITLGGSGTARTVTVTPAAGQTGVATISLAVSDGLLSASTSFQLTVTATPAGLVAAYAFNEIGGTTTLDGSGNGILGTLTNGATFAAGKNGNAVSLDGANDFVTLGNPSLLQLTGSMTISGWITASAFPSDDAVIVSKRSASPLGMQLDTTVDRGSRTVGFKLTNAAGSNMFRYGVTVLQLNTWYHVAGVYNASAQTLNVYVNGQLDNGVLVGTVTTTQQNSSTAVHIGQRPGAPGTFNFAGKIDDVRLYSRALTQADIQADMTTPVGGTPPPNTPPTITSLGNQVTNEDTATGALGFTVGDAETAPGSLTVTASSSNLALVPTANLALGGSGAARTVTVTPVANQSGTATITLTVSDGQAPASTSFLLTVLPVNDPPTITGIANQTIPVGGVVGPLAFTVGDLETAAGSLTVSGSSSNPTLVPDPNITLGGSGTARTVTVTPAAGQTGVATISLAVSDGLLSASTSFQLTVTAVNTPPTITSLGNQVTNEDTATGALGFTVGDAETAPGSLTVTASSSNLALVPTANLALGGSGAARTVTVTPVANQSGTATITLTVSDGQAPASTSFLLTVLPVNDPPTITGIANQTIPVGGVVGPLAFTVGDLETAAGSLTVSGSSSNPTLVPDPNITLGGSGTARTVTVTPAAGQTGVATISLAVSDGLLSASTSFQLTVTATPAGLVAAYAFNEIGGTTTLDGSGNGILGTLTNGATFAAGKNGNAVSLDGANDFVTLGNPSLLQLTGSMTISGWITASAFPSDDAVIVSKRSASPLGMQLDTTVDRGSRTVGFKLTNAAGSNMFRYGVTVLQLNTWYHVAGVYNASAQTLNVYVNGQLDNGVLVGTVTTTQQNSSTAVHIGQRPGAPGTFNFAGKIDDVRLYSRALTQAEIQADMATPVNGPPSSDTTPPNVTITAPVADSTVSALVSVVADVSDDVGVGAVQFQLDGQSLGEEVTSAPYAVTWNTGTSATGNHVLTAVAFDVSGNSTTSAPVTVTVATATPNLVGQWTAPLNWPLVAVHAILLRTGRVLVWDGQGSGAGSQRVWDPATGVFTSVPAPDNIFCAGMVALADGRILVVGGHVSDHVGITHATIFDPVTLAWSPASSMAFARWYPTATTLQDGRVLVVAGQVDCRTCIAPIPEVFDPVANDWIQLPGASLVLPYYPHMFVLPDGRLLNTSASQGSVPARILDVSAQTWTVVDPVVVDGIATMYRPGKVMKTGTSFDPNDPSVSSSNAAYVLDMTQPSPAWREVAPMAFPRTYHNLTLLPDGNVLVTGGGITTAYGDSSGGVLTSELWSPATESWSSVASSQVARLYHSTAVLLPDGRVLVAGGGRVVDGNDPSIKLNAEIYSPPYLFKGARPTITSAPTDIQYDTSFVVQTANAPQIASVSLIRLGSVTHAFNEDQRFLDLAFEELAGALNIQAPANANLAPPGYYMLFIVDTSGVPSVASIMRVH